MNEMRSHWKVLSREMTGVDLGFRVSLLLLCCVIISIF